MKILVEPSNVYNYKITALGLQQEKQWIVNTYLDNFYENSLYSTSVL